MSDSLRQDSWRWGVAQASHAERVRLLFDFSRISMAGALAAVLLIVILTWPAVGDFGLLVWLIPMLGNIAALAWLQHRFRAVKPAAESIPLWERRYALNAAARGLLWGTSLWLLTPQADESVRLFLVFTLCTICLGATALLTPSRNAYRAFMACLMLPATSYLLFIPAIGMAAGGALIVCLAALVGVQDALYRNLHLTLEKRFESEALAAEHRVIFDSAAEAIGLIRPNYLAKCNRQWCALFGIGMEESVGKPAWATWPSYDEWRQFAKECMGPISQGKPYSAIVQQRRASGELFWAEISGMAVDPSNLDLGVVWMGTDISERLKTETDLKASEQRFRDLVSLSMDWYWEIDRDFRFTRIASPMAGNAAHGSEAGLGHRPWELPFAQNVSQPQWQAHRSTLMAHLPFRDFCYQVVRSDGEKRWLSISGNPAFDEQGDFSGYHGVGTDITERIEAAERFRHLAHHDVLTGLPNRRMLSDRVEQALALGKRSGHLVALLLLDLDDFKIINDTEGHSAGDAVLVVIAQRLRGLVREIDTVARLGGDEFVILLQEMVHPRDAIRVAEKIIEAVREPIEVGGRQYLLGVSVGIAHFPEHAANMEGLLQKADIAMYEAKQAGGSVFRFSGGAVPGASAGSHASTMRPDAKPTH